MDDSHPRGRSWSRNGQLALATASLGGMAYCHIVDVGMKFEEHVYYMATLFCANIVASLALIPALLWAQKRDAATRRRVWLAAGGLAVATIVGFLWSRTIGFPQMADHIGDWHALGLASLVFESTVAVVSYSQVVALGRTTVASRGVVRAPGSPW